MRGAAVHALAAALLVGGCVKTPPAAAPVPAAFQATFTARVSSTREGIYRLRGALASAPGGRFRAEISGPTVTAPLLVVVGTESLSAILVSERIAWSGPTEAPLLRELIGLDLPAASIARLISGEAEVPRPGCTASRRGWKRIEGGGGRIASRVEVRCDGGAIHVRLKDPKRLRLDGPRDPFAPLQPPPGYERVDLATLARSLRRVAAEPR